MKENPVVENSLTIEDIHEIRYANYEYTKNMTHEEIIEHTRKEAQFGLDLLRELRKSKSIKTNAS